MSSLIQSSGLTAFAVPNSKLTDSVSANALTVALVTAAGNTPTPIDPLFYATRTVASSGDAFVGKHIIQSVSLVLPATLAGLGTTNGIPFRYWFALFDDGGTPRLAVRNCYNVGSGVIYAANEDGIDSTVPLSSQGSSGSFGTWYSNDTSSSVVTITNASPAVVSWTAHGLVADQAVRFTTTGGLPTGLTVAGTYYVISAGLTADAFEVSATKGGAAINTSSAGSGTHTAHAGIYNKPFRLLGYKEWNSGLATAGTWSIASDATEMFSAGKKRPGDVIQGAWLPTFVASNDATAGNVIPNDGSIPQSGEGITLVTDKITPRSKINEIRYDGRVQLAHSVATKLIAAVFKDSGANAVAVSWGYVAGTNQPETVPFAYRFQAATLSEVSLNLRAGGANAGTIYVNSDAGDTAAMGGKVDNFVRSLKEIMT